MRRIITVVVVLLVVLVGAGVYWFVIRDDSPAKLGLTTTDNSSNTTSGQAPASLDGTWTVSKEAATQAGLRINEKFIGGTVTHTAVGRSPEVTGSITIAGTKVPSGDLKVDLTALAFTDSPPGLNVANRSKALHDVGLQTSQFPDTTFKITKPVDFGKVPSSGDPVSATVTGELTLHGTTKTITVPVDAQLVGDEIEIASHDPVPVKLTDYGMTKPKFGPVADVSDTGSFEFKIRFKKSS